MEKSLRAPGQRLPPERLPRMCGALYKFLTRPYFRRVWVIQEVAFASNPWILCSENYHPSFEALDMAASNLLLMLTSDPGLCHGIVEAHPDLDALWARWGQVRGSSSVMDANAKRLLIFAPDGEPWSGIAGSWNNTLHIPSKAGTGLDTVALDDVIGVIAGSV